MEEKIAKMMSDCLFAMVIEMRPEVTSLLQANVSNFPSYVDPTQKAIVDKMVSNLLAARTKPAFWRGIYSYRQRHRFSVISTTV